MVHVRVFGNLKHMNVARQSKRRALLFGPNSHVSKVKNKLWPALWLSGPPGFV